MTLPRVGLYSKIEGKTSQGSKTFECAMHGVKNVNETYVLPPEDGMVIFRKGCMSRLILFRISLEVFAVSRIARCWYEKKQTAKGYQR